MILVLFGLYLVPALFHPDPAPGLAKDRARARTFECERLELETAARRRPGDVKPARPRGEYLERSALVCTQRLVRPGLRDDRDEAILASLGPLAGELTAAAGDLHPELAGRTWLVEAFYPSVAVSGKLAFAAKDALVSKGLRVSDRTPVLSAGDVDVLTRMSPEEAYPAACARWRDNGSLGADDVLFAIVSRDPRETTLHAGVCAGEGWAWLK
ncbi:MAG: hypothetical protein ACOZNI_21880 [Myxococcota bacterium]